jgi:hypothetical protein
VVPNVDETLLQYLLGRARFPEYTQRHRVQMRRGQVVELGERLLILDAVRASNSIRRALRSSCFAGSLCMAIEPSG